jgi:Fe-S cluster assembly protein SufD
MQLFKGALYDTSKSSFEGKIFVAQEAQKTDAFQLNNNLLLGPHAQAYSKPNLEIFADDVKASHGATVGQLDEKALFYLQTRGVSRSEAQAMCAEGFALEVADQIPLEALRERVAVKVKSKL